MKIRTFKDISIKLKLTLLFLVMSLLTLLICGSLFIYNDVKVFKANIVRNLLILSRTVGNNCVASLLSDDQESAATILASMKEEKQVQFVVLYDARGRIFASYKIDESITKIHDPYIKGNGFLFLNAKGYSYGLNIVQEIMFEGRMIGKIFLDVHLDELARQTKDHISLLAFLLVLTFFISLAIAIALQKIISRPILRLTEKVRSISEGGDYSTHIDYDSGDELGALYSSFNKMTLQINKRERELLKTGKLESLGVLAGGVAHDFRNILQGMLSCIHLLKIKTGAVEKSGDIKKNLDTLEKMCFSAKDLTGQLLTFSRGGEPVREICSVPDMVMETVDFALRGTPVESEYSIHDGIWPCEIDAGQIVHVLNNVIFNAIQAMPEGGKVKIELKNFFTRNHERSNLKEGKYVEVSVADQGLGIPATILPRIFDPFFTTKEGGSGLGLATVYSIVKRHEGWVTVESKQNEGTTIRIYLPASDEKPALKEPAKKSTPLKKKKILFMDDDVNLRYFMGELLYNKGFDVVCACEGMETIELYKKAEDSGIPFDIVVMDLTVPGGMGGGKAVKKLLEIDAGAVVIVSSAYLNSPVMASYKEYGFRAILHKPYTFDEFISATERALESKTQPQR